MLAGLMVWYVRRVWSDHSFHYGLPSSVHGLFDVYDNNLIFDQDLRFNTTQPPSQTIKHDIRVKCICSVAPFGVRHLATSNGPRILTSIDRELHGTDMLIVRKISLPIETPQKHVVT